MKVLTAEKKKYNTDIFDVVNFYYVKKPTTWKIFEEGEGSGGGGSSDNFWIFPQHASVKKSLGQDFPIHFLYKINVVFS